MDVAADEHGRHPERLFASKQAWHCSEMRLRSFLDLKTANLSGNSRSRTGLILVSCLDKRWTETESVRGEPLNVGLAT